MSKTLWLVLGVSTSVVLGTQLERCLTCAPEQDASVSPDLRSAGGQFLASREPGSGAPSGEPVPGPEMPDVPDVPDVASGVGRAEGTDGDVSGTAVSDDDGGAEEQPLVKLVPEAREKENAGTAKQDEAAASGKLSITFDKLASYDYKFPDVGAEAKDTKQIPPSVQKLGGREISIRGFMIPMANDGEDVLEFVLVRNQFACCYGIMPKMNEWVHVKMAPGKTAPFALDIPITVHGTLDVGEVWENGVVMSLYRLECDRVDEPPVYR